MPRFMSQLCVVPHGVATTLPIFRAIINMDAPFTFAWALWWHEPILPNAPHPVKRPPGKPASAPLLGAFFGELTRPRVWWSEPSPATSFCPYTL